MAPITASVPELQNTARSVPPSSHTSSAARPASGDWGPSTYPRSTCSWMARVTKSGAWPNRAHPYAMPMSTYSLPSRSHIREPRPRATTTGYRISFHARRKRAVTRVSASGR